MTPAKIQGDRWFAILLVYLVVKSLHELGHVLACAHWKADCKEIGILILFLAPCLYCDTTECWKLRSRWQRAAVAAGGIYVELIIACIATIVWLNTREGLEHTLAASTMLMCSVGTILINGNPFFKYDWILYRFRFVWEFPTFPNKRPRRSGRSLYACWEDANQIEPSSKPIFGRLHPLPSYRVFIAGPAIILLGWLVWMTLAPSGLGFVALIILTSLSFGVLSSLYRSLSRLFLEFFTTNPISVMRFLYFVSSLLLILILGSTLPLPNYIRARGLLDFADKIPVYASQTAAIRFVESLNDPLDVGQLVIELDCPEKIAEFDKLQMEINYMEAKLAILRKSSVDEPSAAYDIPLIMESLLELKSKRKLMAPEMEALLLRAPMNCFFVPSNTKVPQAIASPKHQSLSSHPTSASNLGCFVERGALLGWFSQKRMVVFQTLVSESEIKSIRIGMRADCVLDSQTNDPILGKVSRISPDPVGELATELMGDPMFVAKRNEKGVLQPDTPHYLVTVEAGSRCAFENKGSCLIHLLSTGIKDDPASRFRLLSCCF